VREGSDAEGEGIPSGGVGLEKEGEGEREGKNRYPATEKISTDNWDKRKRALAAEQLRENTLVRKGHT